MACLKLSTPESCSAKFILMKMGGETLGVPCDWDMGVCMPRVDCAFENPNLYKKKKNKMVPTPKPTQGVDDFCVLFDDQLSCEAFLCKWDDKVQECWGTDPPAQPKGEKACPVLKTESECMDWQHTLGCNWSMVNDICEYKRCGTVFEWDCENWVRCRYDSAESMCVDKNDECKIDLSWAESEDDARFFCEEMVGCQLMETGDMMSPYLCKPKHCHEMTETECEAVPHRCKGEGSRKKYRCTEVGSGN